MINKRSVKEVGLIRDACAVVIKVLEQLKKDLRPGISTAELNKQAEGLIKRLGARPAFKGYRGYPASICTSINEQIVHGIPGERKLQEGDILSLDVGAKLRGYFGDAAWTFAVGEISPSAKKLLSVGQAALSKGIAQARAGNHLTDISNSIQSYVEASGFSVVRKFVGHGIGRSMHEEPEIPNFGRPGIGPVLEAGMVLAIEPMVNEGTFEIEILPDKWTAITKDRKLSAHFEHTICVTEGKPEILTKV